MTVPDYATFFILLMSIFVTASLTALVVNGLWRAQLDAQAARKFAFRISAYGIIWVTAVLCIAYTNILVPRQDQNLPLLAVFIFGPTFLGTILLFKSKSADAVLRATPAHLLATIQIYRIIGVVFLLLQADGLLPAYFANSTAWGDILVGVTAPVVGYLLWKDAKAFRLVGLAWCVVGIGDLLLVLYKAINSAPGPLQTTSFDLPTVIVGYFPFPVIPLLIVPISLILHVLLIRKLIRTA